MFASGLFPSIAASRVRSSLGAQYIGVAFPHTLIGCIIGSVVECVIAIHATRVRFTDDAFFLPPMFFLFFLPFRVQYPVFFFLPGLFFSVREVGGVFLFPHSPPV